jgi:hypothetical protein
MSYNTQAKKTSPMKNSFNKFFSTLTKPSTVALVIDAETLMTATSLVTAGASPENIQIINYDQKVIELAHKNGHVNSVPGLSTEVLRNTNSTFDIIYLDYCGFPDKQSNGFDPHFDMLWAATHLNQGGVVVATFSRRAKNCMEKAESFIAPTLSYVKGVPYFESSAMFSLILTKGGDAPALRRLFNETKIEQHAILAQESAEALICLAQPKPKANDPLLGRRVRVRYRMTDGSFSFFEGIVKKHFRNKTYHVLFEGYRKSERVPLPLQEENINWSKI